MTRPRELRYPARMLDHVSLRVQDFRRALEFYKAALAPIGYTVAMEYPGGAGLGEPGKPDLWISLTEKSTHPTHLAFRTSRARVDAFHAAALAAGATDNGPPGVRADYHPHYYAAFVYDPEGNNIEVVCHDPPAATKPAPVRAASARRPAKKVRKPPRKPARKAAKPTKPTKPTKKRR
jgi:catechol 2,3-dioxygenase-like lactoylglutathione lyase family enzyme